MAKFKITNNAVKELFDIWSYTVETWSESQADKYYKLIIKPYKLNISCLILLTQKNQYKNPNNHNGIRFPLPPSISSIAK